jgi:hypothetical protein
MAVNFVKVALWIGGGLTAAITVTSAIFQIMGVTLPEVARVLRQETPRDCRNGG